MSSFMPKFDESELDESSEHSGGTPSAAGSTCTLYTFSHNSSTGRALTWLSDLFLAPHDNRSGGKCQHTKHGAAFVAFLSLLLVTFANNMLTPMRDAAALALGVGHIPNLTLASTLLAFCSSVPMGWLFEAPNPDRKYKRWRDKIGLTRGETQGTSLALFYRIFAVLLLGYALGFQLVDYAHSQPNLDAPFVTTALFYTILHKFWAIFYIAFYLVGNLMKLYSVSLLWGVASEAMEYEEQAEVRLIHNTCTPTTSRNKNQVEDGHKTQGKQSRTRLERLEFVGFGSTLGGILGSMFVSFTAQTLRLSGLLIIAAILLAISAELSVELGQMMLRHWEEEQKDRLSNTDLQSLETNTWEWTPDTSSYTTQGILSPTQSLSSSNAATTESVGDNNISLEGMNHSTSHHNLILTNHVDTSIKNMTSFGSMKRIASNHGMVSLNQLPDSDNIDSSLKKTTSFGSMKRIASCHGMVSLNQLPDSDNIDSSLKKTTSFGSMKRVASNHGMVSLNQLPDSDNIDSSLKKTTSFGSMKRIASNNSMGLKLSNSVSEKLGDMGLSTNQLHKEHQHSQINNNITLPGTNTNILLPSSQPLQSVTDDSLFKQRLLRGISTILRSRLLMTIFTYNALYATTNFLLSYQRAELVANRKKTSSSNGASKKVDSHAAFLARINIVSNTTVFLLQGSGLGAWIATTLGQRGTLALMPLARAFGVSMLVLWHIMNDGSPPNLTLFLILDELTKVINFAVAKPVRESLWHGLSNEARYEAKPIVDTMANRWGGGSAAFLMSLLGKIMDFTGLGEITHDGSKTLFGFPPVLMLCAVSAAWWLMVSLDLGAIRHRIDVELKKKQ